jgi:hypothetical protein
VKLHLELRRDASARAARAILGLLHAEPAAAVT